ncbi:chlororespiratory reduction 6 domain-containing protein [Paraburkholderia tropica]|uniref:chlororespiratory reduction 6 domain-containing protein n=1 Tax=Paraburkholderia tropica TaxID=92647 RepID=UPI001F18BB8F|nr:chlororespiratory reduction 6 domain-containing protein [Paraburkholderia tropica]
MFNFDSMNPLVIVISHKEINAGDIAPALSTLQRLVSSPEVSRKFFENVDIAFDGYDTDARDLFEIDEVRSYVYRLDEEFPFWLYFLSKENLGLQCLTMCFLPPYLTAEARSRIYPERIDELLSNRWFPAMNQICDYVGMTDGENERLTERVIHYITQGPTVA